VVASGGEPPSLLFLSVAPSRVSLLLATRASRVSLNRAHTAVHMHIPQKFTYYAAIEVRRWRNGPRQKETGIKAEGREKTRRAEIRRDESRCARHYAVARRDLYRRC